MHRSLAVLLVFGCGLADLCAAPATKTPYYRPHHTKGAPPRAAGDPVVTNAASFEPGVCAGGLATVFGSDLTSVTGAIVASTIPLPFVLANVSVTVNGVPAPIYSVAYANGQDQVTFQTPGGTATGPGAAQVEVFDGDVETANVFTDSFTEDPGIFVYQGNFAIAVRVADGSLIGPANPAIPGEELALYTTGLGPVSVFVPDGYPGPTNPLAYTIDPLQVVVDNENAQIDFSGLAPGFVGLYQINFRVPIDAAVGNLGLQIQTPYASSDVVVLPVS